MKKISTSTSKYLPLKKAGTEKVNANAAAAIVKMPVSTAIRVMDITTTTPQYRDTADNTAKRELLEAANAARKAKFKDRAMQLYSNPKASDKEILKMFEQAMRRNRAKSLAKYHEAPSATKAPPVMMAAAAEPKAKEVQAAALPAALKIQTPAGPAAKPKKVEALKVLMSGMKPLKVRAGFCTPRKVVTPLPEHHRGVRPSEREAYVFFFKGKPH